MVKYYVTLEVYGEKNCLHKLEAFCKERGITFEISDLFDSDSYAEYRKKVKT